MGPLRSSPNPEASAPTPAPTPAQAPPSARQALAAALRAASYEILPFRSAEENVLTHLPKNVALTVTTTAAKGLQPTVDLAARLSRAGYRSAPHLAARLVRDRAHLRDLVAQLREAGVDDVFVIGGDAEQPVGDLVDALGVLEALDGMGRPFSSVGIGGYPEGHGTIPDEQIVSGLRVKAPYCTYVISQLCFDAATTRRWARTAFARGGRAPIRVGIPGAVNRQKLVRISAGLGLGQSARFITKQQSMLWRFFLPGGYSPNKLVERLAPAFAETDNALAGFHLFTFNEIEGTEKWRQRWLARLS